MPRSAHIQTNFTAGELSPRLVGRTDISRYSNGAAEVLNYIVTPYGGVARRPGTRYVAEVKNSADIARLVPFEFSTEQAYALEFGDAYFRIYRNQGRVFAPDITAAITNGDFPSDLSGWTASSVSHSSAAALFASGGTLDQAITITETTTNHVLKFQITGDERSDRVNVRLGTSSGGEQISSDIEFEVGWHTFAFAPAGNSTVHLRFTQSAGTPSLDNVSLIDDGRIEVATPWADEDLAELNWTQSADVLYVTHPSYAPRKITRRDDSSWSVTYYNFLDGPYEDVNTGATTMTPAATSGDGVTLTASTATFLSTDVGRLIRIEHSSTWGWAVIVAYSSTTQVDVDIKSNFGGTSGVTDWRIGAWSDSSGWPAVVTFHEERLTFGRVTDQPQTVWMSVTADFENHAPTETDGTLLTDSAVTFTISDDRVNAILWFSSGQRLAIGTTSAEFTLSASSSGGVVTPSDKLVQRQTTHGSANIRPQRIGAVVIFAQRQAKKLREFSFSFQLDQFSAPDLTILADHVTGTGIVEMDFQQEPFGVLWCVREDGTLIGMTYERDQEVVGWHRHVIGGVSDDSGTQAKVESICVIPGDGQDELWLIVKRYVDGATVRYVEFMEYDWDPERSTTDTKASAFFVDSGLSYNGSATTTLTDLDHLEGESVSILGDGAVFPNDTVDTGAVATSVSVTEAQIGLGYASRVKTLRPDSGSADGTAQGKLKRIHEIVVRLYNTLGLKYGPSTSKLDSFSFRTGSTVMDTSPDVFTGDKVIPFHGNWDRDAQVVLQQDQPLPSTILAVIKRMNTSDG
jgi:hypothetical protein